MKPMGVSGPRLRTGIQVLPMQADEPCGDAAAAWPCPGPDGAAATHWLLAIVDGLGHGREAAGAAQAAIELLGTDPMLPLPEQFARLEERLRPTRGAAVGLMQVGPEGLRHAGIGNTRAMLLRGDALTRLPSQNGIVGGGHAVQIEVQSLPWMAGDWLLMFTDGIDERLGLPMQLPEWRRDPATLCRHLMDRWRLGRDDAGVLVASLDADAGSA